MRNTMVLYEKDIFEPFYGKRGFNTTTERVIIELQNMKRGIRTFA